MKKRICTDETAEQLIGQYTGVVKHCLNRMNLSRSRSDYDDYFQLGLMTLMDTYETCTSDPLQEDNRYIFVSYASRKIMWVYLDEIRKTSKKGATEALLSDEVMLNLPCEDTFEDILETEDLYRTLSERLSPQERSYLDDAYIHGLNITEIAKKNGISRKTVYKWRSQIQTKAEGFLAPSKK